MQGLRIKPMTVRSPTP